MDGYNPVVVNVSGEPEPPDDGKTRLYITVPANSIPDRPPPRNQVPLYIQQTVDRGVTIDWGDGTELETLPGIGLVNATHSYEKSGDYVIILDPTDECNLILGSGESGYSVIGSTGSYGSVYRNMLKKVVVGTSFEDIISEYAFSGCKSLFSVVIPNNVKTIKTRAFNGCSNLSSINIPESVETIESFSFFSCSSISSAVIKKGVKSIGKSSFSDCYGVKEYHFLSTEPPSLLRVDAFSYIPSDCIIYVPVGSLEAYQTATNWATYADQMQEEPA